MNLKTKTTVFELMKTQKTRKVGGNMIHQSITDV